MRHLLPMNELDSAIFHFFATGPPALSTWADAPVIAMPATASATRSTVTAPMRAILLLRVIACRPPSEFDPPEAVSCDWAQLASLARTTPSRLRGAARQVGSEPPLEV